MIVSNQQGEEEQLDESLHDYVEYDDPIYIGDGYGWGEENERQRREYYRQRVRDMK